MGSHEEPYTSFTLYFYTIYTSVIDLNATACLQCNKYKCSVVMILASYDITAWTVCKAFTPTTPILSEYFGIDTDGLLYNTGN